MKRLASAGPKVEEKRLDISRDIEYKAISRKMINKN